MTFIRYPQWPPSGTLNILENQINEELRYVFVYYGQSSYEPANVITVFIISIYIHEIRSLSWTQNWVSLDLSCRDTGTASSISDFKRFVFLCSINWCERWLFILMLLVELLTIVDHYCLFFPFITENWKLRNPNPTTIVANSPLSAYIGDEKGSGIVWIIDVKSNSLGSRRRSKCNNLREIKFYL